MSLTVTQRPYQTINSELSNWNAVANPVLYKMQRKDFTFASITNHTGSVVRLVLDASFGDVSTSFDVNDVVYFITDGGIYDTTGTVTASSYSAPNTLVTLNTTYISSSTGFVNNDYLRPLYRIDINVYDEADTLLTSSAFAYSPTSKGAATIDVSAILRAQMSPDNDADLTGTDKVFADTTIATGFYITYNEVWTGSANTATNDSTYTQYSLLGSLQIPSTYGGNIYDYLILSDMKIADVTLTAAQILAGNTTAMEIVAAPGAGYIIVPVKYFLFLDYGSAAFATNTTWRFEMNGVAVSATNTTILPGVADRYTTMEPVDYDTTTDLKNQALKLEVQTGDPTAGNSTVRVVCIYTVKQIA